MLRQSVSLGQLVLSTAGRDQGVCYMVVGLCNTPFLLLANGRDRKIANPKKKNIRHLTILNSIAEVAVNKLKNGARLSDEDIRQATTILYTPEIKAKAGGGKCQCQNKM